MIKKDEHKPVVTDVHSANGYFSWSWKGCGFGQFSFNVNTDTGEVGIDSECMSKESSRKLLYTFADYMIDKVDWDKQ